MPKLSRREFGYLAAGAIAAQCALPRPMLAQGAPRIIVIGGGAGGAAAASHLKAANPKLDVTLIEPKQTYTTCFYSNLYIGGFRSRAFSRPRCGGAPISVSSPFFPGWLRYLIEALPAATAARVAP